MKKNSLSCINLCINLLVILFIYIKIATALVERVYVNPSSPPIFDALSNNFNEVVPTSTLTNQRSSLNLHSGLSDSNPSDETSLYHPELLPLFHTGLIKKVNSVFHS